MTLEDAAAAFPADKGVVEAIEVEPLVRRRFPWIAPLIVLIGQAVGFFFMQQAPAGFGQILWDQSSALEPILILLFVAYLFTAVIASIPYHNWGPKLAILPAAIFLPASAIVVIAVIALWIYNRRTGRDRPDWLEERLARNRARSERKRAARRAHERARGRGSGAPAPVRAQEAERPATGGRVREERDVVCPACYEVFPFPYEGRPVDLVCPACGRRGRLGGTVRRSLG